MLWHGPHHVLTKLECFPPLCRFPASRTYQQRRISPFGLSSAVLRTEIAFDFFFIINKLFLSVESLCDGRRGWARAISRRLPKKSNGGCQGETVAAATGVSKSSTRRGSCRSRGESVAAVKLSDFENGAAATIGGTQDWMRFVSFKKNAFSRRDRTARQSTNPWSLSEGGMDAWVAPKSWVTHRVVVTFRLHAHGVWRTHWERTTSKTL